jgi:DNA-binding transcriptional ArsR family regulator
MPTDLSKLIEAINRVGIQNVSLLSRMTGMPTETIRYTMKKRFPNMGLKVRTPLNHGALGLERYFVSLKLTPEAEKSESAILAALSSNAFLTYWCKAAIERRQLAFFSVPVSLVDEFRGFLNRLVKEGVLVDYSIERLEWSRNPELKSRYYDFSTGKGSIDWEKVKRSAEAPPVPVRNEEPSASPEVDVTDMLIIKELELDSWRNIAEIARKLKLNERTVRWHYRKHVAHTVHSNYVNWTSVTPNEFTEAGGLICEFSGVSKETLAKLRHLFNNFPFSWFEGGRKDGYYQVHSALPAEYFMESVRFLNASLAEIVENWKTWTIDLSTTLWYTIPYENFDDKKGWFFNEDAALEAVLPQRMKIKQRSPS